ncbi:16S rRNA (guanine(966)-N(2))-methyltransferase RsmD [Geobacter sp. FeAm09]|uniref:16S rRNA (guanine(966)-N(2))-methyltransferase RsmD n=1 Tax=Geobacter sp. FeAm09 TaxID=2597769 RepID=UPI0011EEA98C|nr:16S rRNA (guanine(966)-N(2))-methyltransferase RsmD [Geobacter sp. FeAm09]QEM68792.1 16S rRNA (guanine(966)-N(2))-methyltransferase RsmD [Geobacter sp. FeAm09]
MRVIAGSVRGMRLAAPRGMQTRPTADRVREALFSIISSRRGLEEAQVLDICAGTGGLGIEALSRGAAFCCFVEHDRRVQAVLEKNLEVTGLAARSQLLTVDCLKAVRLLASQGRRFDVVFFDPPYASALYGTVPEALDNLHLLADDGLLVVECAARNPLPERVGALIKDDRRVYGDTALEFFTLEGA